MTPKISVIIPSYNKVRFIEKTLESIVSQEYPNLEVLIQDGGSNDGSLEVIKKYSRKYPKTIKWESKRDNGQLDAINKGMNKASGDVLAYINADDLYEKRTFVRIAKEYLANSDALWFAGRGTVIDAEGWSIAKPVTWYKTMLLSFNFYPLLLMTNYLMQPSVFITRKAWEKYGPFIGVKEFITEYDLWLKIGKLQMPNVLNENLSKFRIEPATKTKQMSGKLLKEDEKIVKRYTKNSFILILHKLNNLGRILVGGSI